MSLFPEAHHKLRSPRMHLVDVTPAVLGLQDSWRIRGKLEVISVTGGLLCLSKSLRQGCQVKVLFLTHAGPVLGAAEMRTTVPGGLQPFRFTTLGEVDRVPTAGRDSALHGPESQRPRATRKAAYTS